MHKTFRVNAATAMAVAIAVGGLLVGCGSSSKSSSTTKAPAATTAAPTTKSGSSVALVNVKKNDKLGAILADKDKMTLYTLTNNGKPVACTGACLNAWPPLVVPAGESKPSGSAGVTGLSTVMGADGAHLAAVNGLPLYRFVQDKDSEDAYGEGLKSFGGTWHVSKTSAAPTNWAGESATTAPPTTQATTSSGY